MFSPCSKWGGCIFVILLCLFLPLTVFPQDTPRIAVLDFDVQSSNPDYQYLGKGFAEFVAVELAAVKDITLVEREKRNAVLEEQKFALSGLVDESTGVEIGNLLAANYLVSGSIFDMFGQLAVTVKLVDVEKGSVAVNAQADGEPKQYKRMVGELSQAILSSLGFAEAAIPEAEAAPAELENEEADTVLASFSKAVDAVDNDNIDEARENLNRAKKIDKTNRAVQYYLNKLFLASPKFNVELIFYAPSYNPAYLGFIEKDRMYTTLSTNAPSLFYTRYPEDIDGHRDFKWEVKNGLYYSYGYYKGEIGYYFPLGENFGLAAEYSGGFFENITRDQNYDLPGSSSDDHVYLRSGGADHGGRLSAGLSLSDSIALGLSGYLFYHVTNLGGDDDADSPRSHNVTGSSTLGAYFKLFGGGLTLDSHITVPFIQEVYLDYDIKDYVAYKTAPYPLAWETNLIGKLAGGRLFLSLKEVLEIYTSFGEDERTGIASRTIPAVEWWPTTFFSVRVGGEYDLVSLLDNISHGFGVMGGLSFRIGPVDIDANYTYMQRSLRFYPGLTVPDTALLVQVSLNGAFIKERK
jgi:TolB-like protein